MSAACESAKTMAPRLACRERGAGQVESAPLRCAGVGGDHPARGDGEREADGEVDEEDRLPAESSVRTPPSSTPTAAPAPPTAPQAASAWVRGVPFGNVLIRIDSAAGESIAAPSPWPARAANSVAALPASAAAE